MKNYPVHNCVLIGLPTHDTSVSAGRTSCVSSSDFASSVGKSHKMPPNRSIGHPLPAVGSIMPNSTGSFRQRSLGKLSNICKSRKDAAYNPATNEVLQFQRARLARG